MLGNGECKDLIGALVKFHAAAPKLVRDAEGMDGNRKYRYATLANAIDVIDAKFPELGLGHLQSVGTSDDGKIVVETFIAHESGQSISSVLAYQPDRTDIKGIGSAITYLRRYSLVALAGLAPDDDDDGDAAMPSSRNAPRRIGNGGAPKPPMPNRRAAKEMVKAAEGEPEPTPTVSPDIVGLKDRHGNTANYSMLGEPTSIAAAIQTDLVDCGAESVDELERAWKRHYRIWKRLDAEPRNKLEALKDRLKAKHDSAPAPPPAGGYDMPDIPDYLRREPTGGAQT